MTAARADWRRRTAADMVTESLAQLPSRIARLVWCARCWRPDEQLYAHDGIALQCPAADVARAVAAHHSRLWRQWLMLDLRAQTQDLELYMGAPADQRRTARRWLQSEPWRTLSPPDADDAERMLYAADMRAALRYIDPEEPTP